MNAACEELELHILHMAHMDSIDFDSKPILGIDPVFV
jgi:hypothetical protein